MPCSQRGTRVVRNGLAEQAHLHALARREPGDPPRDPGASGADQPGEAEDLALTGS